MLANVIRNTYPIFIAANTAARIIKNVNRLFPESDERGGVFVFLNSLYLSSKSSTMLPMNPTIGANGKDGMAT